MNVPNNLRYAKSHEWVSVTAEEATIGLTDFAQHALGDIVFINLPEVGDEVEAGESFTDLESVKAVSDIYSPVGGTVSAVNEELLDEPGKINDAPYDAWIIKVSPFTLGDGLLSPEEYAGAIAEEEN